MTDASSPRPRMTDPLEVELVALGRSLHLAPPPSDLADRVLTAIATSTEPVTSWPASLAHRLAARPRRVAAAVTAALVLVVALVPPVRAAVVELLRIGGVAVREVPPPTGYGPSEPVTVGPPAPAPDPVSTRLASVADAQRITGMTLRTPGPLGTPTTVALGHGGRIVELTWESGSRSVRLDVFDGTLSYGYLKSVWQAVTPTSVAGREAVWFGEPHLIEWVDRSGTTRRTPPRVAGPTLVWVERNTSGREVTYRLEGPSTLEEALRLATAAMTG